MSILLVVSLMVISRSEGNGKLSKDSPKIFFHYSLPFAVPGLAGHLVIMLDGYRNSQLPTGIEMTAFTCIIPLFYPT